MTQIAFAPDVFTWPADEPQLIGGRCADVRRRSRSRSRPSCARCGSTERRARTCCPAGARSGPSPPRSSCPRSPTPAARRRRRSAPYGVGLVQLGDEVRVEGRLTESDPAELRIGMEVELVVVPFRTDDDGTEVMTFAFAPRSHEEGAEHGRRRHHRGRAAPLRPLRAQVGHRHGRRRHPRRAAATPASQWNDVQFAFGGSFEVDNPDAVTSRLGLTGIPFMDVYNGCATAATALQLTADAIRSGQYDIGVAVGMDKHAAGRVHRRPGRLRAPRRGTARWATSSPPSSSP